jgi:hypothetical protein
MDATLIRCEFRGDDIPQGHTAIEVRLVIPSDGPEMQVIRRAWAEGASLGPPYRIDVTMRDAR